MTVANEPLSRTTRSQVNVRYKETDRMAIAHHSNYLVWFEIGRTDLCREAGISYREIEERGFLLVVGEAGCRYRIPYLYDDLVAIETSISDWGSRALRFNYRLKDSTGAKLHATGFTQHFWLDIETRRPVVVPEDILARFQSFFPETGRPARY